MSCCRANKLALLFLVTCLWEVSLEQESLEFQGNLSTSVVFHSDGFPNQKYEPTSTRYYIYRVRNVEPSGGIIQGTLLDFDLAEGQMIEVFFGDYNEVPAAVTFRHTERRRDLFRTNSTQVDIRFTNPRKTDDNVGYVGWRLNCTVHTFDEVLPKVCYRTCGVIDPVEGEVNLRGREVCNFTECSWNIKTGSRSHAYARFLRLSSQRIKNVIVRLSNNSRDGEVVLGYSKKTSRLTSSQGLYIRFSGSTANNWLLKFLHFTFVKYPTLNSTNFTCPASGPWKNDFCCDVGEDGQWRIPFKLRCDGTNHCPKKDDEYSPVCKSTYGGTTRSAKGCDFPFIYEGRSYRYCITKNHDKPWCYTDKGRNKKWGNCFLSKKDFEFHYIPPLPSKTGRKGRYSGSLLCPNGFYVSISDFPVRCSTYCPGKLSCRDGFCLKSYVSLCDGVQDCFDGSDENNVSCALKNRMSLMILSKICRSNYNDYNDSDNNDNDNGNKSGNNQ